MLQLRAVIGLLWQPHAFSVSTATLKLWFLQIPSATKLLPVQGTSKKEMPKHFLKCDLVKTTPFDKALKKLE